MEEKDKIEQLEKKMELIKSGYAGVDRDGVIVDRRENKDAIPLKENLLFGNPKPKPVD